MKRGIIIYFLFAIVVACSVGRAQLVFTNFAFTGNILSTNVSFRQWNPANGPLTNVTFSILNTAVSGAFYVVNGQSTNITVSNPRTRQVFSFAGAGAPASISTNQQSITNVVYDMTPAFPGPGGVLEPAEDGLVLLTSPQPISLNNYTVTYGPGDPQLAYFTGTGTITLSIISTFNLTGIGSVGNLDKSALTTAGTIKLEMIPEPSTWALLVTGSALGFFVLRRRRSSS